MGTPKEAIAEAASSTVRRRGSRLTLAFVLASYTRTSWAWLQADLYDTTAGDLEHPDCATRSFSEEHTTAASYSPLILGRFHIKLRCLLGRCPNKLTAGSSDLKSGRAAESHRISCNRRRKILITDKLIVLLAKRAFPPDLESTRLWEASLEKAKQLLSASAASNLSVAGAGFSLSSPLHVPCHYVPL